MPPKFASSMKRGIKEGGVSAISSSLTETYIPQFALALKASAPQLGWLSAIPNIITPCAQLLGNKLMHQYTRKQLTTRTAYLQALFFLPIAALGWCITKGFFVENALTILIVAYTLMMSVAAISTPAWFSWMGDIIPHKQRGEYFSKRHTAMGIASMLIILGGLALDYYQTQGLALTMFGIIFSIAALARLYSGRLLSQQYEPPYTKREARIPYSFWHFIKQKNATRTFVLYVGLYNLVMYIASPFFPLYMRQDLALSYTWITLISLTSSLFYIIALPYVGTFSDKYGNLRLFYSASILYALNPLVWLLFPNPLILMGVQLIGGLANAMYILGVTNYVLNTVPQKERAIISTYMNIIVGVGIFIGSLIGGYTMTHHPTWLSAITYTFLISALGRVCISLFGIKHMREREHVKALPQESRPSLVHPLRSLIGEVHFLRQLKR